MKSGLRIFATLVISFSVLPMLLAQNASTPAATGYSDSPFNVRDAFGTVAPTKPGITLAPPLLAFPMPHNGNMDEGTPKAELFLGYSYIRNVPASAGNRIDYLHGGSASLALNLNRHVGLVADFGASHANKFGPNAPPIGGTVDASGNAFTFLFGPRISFRHERVTPFVQALFGGMHAGAVTLSGCSGIGCVPLPSETAFAMTAGGGLDVKLTHHFALRVIQVEYLMTRFADRSTLAGQTARQNDVRLSAGIVFRFGGHRHAPEAPPPASPATEAPPPPPPPPAEKEAAENRPPTVNCSADRGSMVIGERVQITANALDPDNDTLTYSWRTTRGRIIGSGASVSFDSTGLAPGEYTVTGHVEDGRGGDADCTVEINAQAAPMAAELEQKLALHSIYFPTAQPTVNDPDGGLVESQQTILRTLAVDFKKYLEFHPEAHLTLEGHADERASVEYNNALAERRVARSKSFLVEQGVSEASIQTKSFGEHQELDEGQVRQQIAENPNLSPESRERMLANLKSIILAQNRRVDVVLSGTGQQSTRRYPFNASDAAILLSDKALEH
jgi:outer membrane protein OmpA-like peptidoglycan-associated protein/opacity protein-like surface antigen